jgi:hypothetical protein
MCGLVRIRENFVHAIYIYKWDSKHRGMGPNKIATDGGLPPPQG